MVDSQDFSLNISREILQHNTQLASISSNLKKKVKAELLRLLKDERDTYKEFFKSFGRQLKYGVVEEYGANKDLLQDLLLFDSAEKNEKITLDEYVDAMKEKQDKIYFISASSAEQAKHMPQTEQVLEKGYDILCLSEDVDEFVMRTLYEYKGKSFCNVTSDDLNLESEEEKKDFQKKEEEKKEILDFAAEVLKDKVSSVKLSHKLKNHAVLLTTEGNITIEMEKYFKDMPEAQGAPKAVRVLEVNASHSAFKALEKAYAKDKKKAERLVNIMYAQSLMLAGLPVENPVEYSEAVFELF